MIAVWSNGRDGSDSELVFVDLIDGDDLRMMTHCVGLLRMLDKTGAGSQKIAAVAGAMTFADSLKPVSFAAWAADAFYAVLGVGEHAQPRELERLIAAIDDKTLQALNLWHVADLAPYLKNRARS